MRVKENNAWIPAARKRAGYKKRRLVGSHVFKDKCGGDFHYYNDYDDRLANECMQFAR